MTTDRCYRNAMGHDAACDELRREAGRQFDPEVVEALVEELSASARSEKLDSGADDGGDSSAPIADEVAAYLRTVLARPLPAPAQVAAPDAASATRPRSEATPPAR